MLALRPKKLDQVVCLVFASPEARGRHALPPQLRGLAEDQIAYVSDSIVRRDGAYVDVLDLWWPGFKINYAANSLPKTKHVVLTYELQKARSLASHLQADLWTLQRGVWAPEKLEPPSEHTSEENNKPASVIWVVAQKTLANTTVSPAVIHALLLAAQHLGWKYTNEKSSEFASQVHQLHYDFVDSLPSDLRPPDMSEAWDPDWRRRTLHRLRRHLAPEAKEFDTMTLKPNPRKVGTFRAPTLPPASYVYDGPSMATSLRRKFSVSYSVESGSRIQISVVLLDDKSPTFSTISRVNDPVVLWIGRHFSPDWVQKINEALSANARVVLHLGNALARNQPWKTNFVLTSWNISDTLQWVSDTYSTAKIVLAEPVPAWADTSQSYGVAHLLARHGEMLDEDLPDTALMAEPSVDEKIVPRDKSTLLHFAMQYASTSLPTDHMYSKFITNSSLGRFDLKRAFDIVYDGRNFGSGRFAWAKRVVEKYEVEFMCSVFGAYRNCSPETQLRVREAYMNDSSIEDATLLLSNDLKYQHFLNRHNNSPDRIAEYKAKLAQRWFNTTEDYDLRKFATSDDPKVAWLAKHWLSHTSENQARRQSTKSKHVQREKTYCKCVVGKISRSIIFAETPTQVVVRVPKEGDNLSYSKWLFDNGLVRETYDIVAADQNIPILPHARTKRGLLVEYFGQRSLPPDILSRETYLDADIALSQTNVELSVTAYCHTVHLPLWNALPTIDKFSTKGMFYDIHQGREGKPYYLRAEFTNSNLKTRRDFVDTMLVTRMDSDALVKQVLKQVKSCTPAAGSFLVGEDNSLLLEKYIKDRSASESAVIACKELLRSNNDTWRSPEHFFHSMWPSIRDHQDLQAMAWLLVRGPVYKILHGLLAGFPFLPESYQDTTKFGSFCEGVKDLLQVFAQVATNHPTCLASAFEICVLIGNWILAIEKFQKNSLAQSLDGKGGVSGAAKHHMLVPKGVLSDANYGCEIDEGLPVHPAKKLAEVYRMLQIVRQDPPQNVKVSVGFVAYKNYLLDALDGGHTNVAQLCAKILGRNFNEWSAYGDLNRFAKELVHRPYDRSIVNSVTGRPFGYDTGVLTMCTRPPTKPPHPKLLDAKKTQDADVEDLKAKYGDWVGDASNENQIASDLIDFLNFFNATWMSDNTDWAQFQDYSNGYHMYDPDVESGDKVEKDVLAHAIVLCARASHTFYLMAKKCLSGAEPNSLQWHTFVPKLARAIGEDVGQILEDLNENSTLWKSTFRDLDLDYKSILTSYNPDEHIVETQIVPSNRTMRVTTVKKIHYDTKTVILDNTTNKHEYTQHKSSLETRIVVQICDMMVSDINEYMDIFDPKVEAPNAVLYWDMVMQLVDSDEESASMIGNESRAERVGTKYLQRVFRVVTGLDHKMITSSALVQNLRGRLEHAAFEMAPVLKHVSAVKEFSKARDTDTFVLAVIDYFEDEPINLGPHSDEATCEFVSLAKNLKREYESYVKSMKDICQMFQEHFTTYYGINGVEMGDFFNAEFRLDVFKMYVHILSQRYNKRDVLVSDLKLSLNPLYILKQYRDVCNLYPKGSCDCTHDLLARILPTNEHPLLFKDDDLGFLADYISDLLLVVNGFLKYHNHAVSALQPPKVSTRAEAEAHILLVEDYLKALCRKSVVDELDSGLFGVRINNYLGKIPIVRLDQHVSLKKLLNQGPESLKDLVVNFYTKFNWDAANEITKSVYSFLIARLAAKCDITSPSNFPRLRGAWKSLNLAYIQTLPFEPNNGRGVCGQRHLVNYYEQRVADRDLSQESEDVEFQSKEPLVNTLQSYGLDTLMLLRPVHRRWTNRKGGFVQGLENQFVLGQTDPRPGPRSTRYRISWLVLARPYVLCPVGELITEASEFLSTSPDTTRIAVARLARAYARETNDNRLCDALEHMPPPLSVYEKIQVQSDFQKKHWTRFDQTYGNWGEGDLDKNVILRAVVQSVTDRSALSPQQVKQLLSRLHSAYGGISGWVVMWTCRVSCDIAKLGSDDYKTEFITFLTEGFLQRFESSERAFSRAWDDCKGRTNAGGLKRLSKISDAVKRVLDAFFANDVGLYSTVNIYIKSSD